MLQDFFSRGVRSRGEAFLKFLSKGEPGATKLKLDFQKELGPLQMKFSGEG